MITNPNGGITALLKERAMLTSEVKRALATAKLDLKRVIDCEVNELLFPYDVWTSIPEVRKSNSSDKSNFRWILSGDIELTGAERLDVPNGSMRTMPRFHGRCNPTDGLEDLEFQFSVQTKGIAHVNLRFAHIVVLKIDELKNVFKSANAELQNLMEPITVSVDFNTKLFKSTNSTLRGLISYNLYLNTYNDQTRVIQFFVNRQLADSKVVLRDEDLIRLFWRLNNFIFAINHNFDLAPNKKRVVIIGWIKEFSESNWDVWNFSHRVPIDVLCEHLEKVSVDRKDLDILDSFRRIDVLNLNLKMGAARQYLHQINHLSNLDIFMKVDVHSLRFDESAEHWLPQKPHKGPNHWGNFLALDADEIRGQLEDAVFSHGSVFSRESMEEFTMEIANLSKKELLKRTVGLFGNLFLLDGKKNSGLKNYGHKTKQASAKWFHFYNLAVSATQTLQTIDEWDINSIIGRTAYIQNELMTNIVKQ